MHAPAVREDGDDVLVKIMGGKAAEKQQWRRVEAGERAGEGKGDQRGRRWRAEVYL